MPRYDYKCPECKDIVELTLPMDHNPPVCSQCNCILSRVFVRAPSFKFVGAGFYSNDYKEKNYDRMTMSQRDSHDSEQADKLDNRYEAEEKAFRQKVRDDLR
tara:strand:- start:3032 stop:3337 length:306 start_codon:yes stop_codon:yes gene_type:complete